MHRTEKNLSYANLQNINTYESKGGKEVCTMRTYHPIHWIETIHWHDVFADKRLWTAVAIIAFVAFIAMVVVIGAKTGGHASTMPYYGGWPYMPYGPMPMH